MVIAISDLLFDLCETFHGQKMDREFALQIS